MRFEKCRVKVMRRNEYALHDENCLSYGWTFSVLLTTQPVWQVLSNDLFLFLKLERVCVIFLDTFM